MPDTLPLLFGGGFCKVKHTPCGKCRGRRLEEAARGFQGAGARCCRLPTPVTTPTNRLGCHLIERTEWRSGVIIDEEGYVLTNLHVVRRAGTVWVKLADGREFEARPIVGNTRKDVALLKLVARGNGKFKAVKFAKDDDLLLGETVLALGNP